MLLMFFSLVSTVEGWLLIIFKNSSSSICVASDNMAKKI